MKPVPTKIWKQYLILCGHKKDIPRFQIDSCLKTMKKTKKEFDNFLSKK